MSDPIGRSDVPPVRAQTQRCTLVGTTIQSYWLGPQTDLVLVKRDEGREREAVLVVVVLRTSSEKIVSKTQGLQFQVRAKGQGWESPRSMVPHCSQPLSPPGRSSPEALSKPRLGDLVLAPLSSPFSLLSVPVLYLGILLRGH